MDLAIYALLEVGGNGREFHIIRTMFSPVHTYGSDST